MFVPTCGRVDLSTLVVGRAVADDRTHEIGVQAYIYAYRLDDIDSQKKDVVESLIYAAVLTLLASRALLRSVASRVGERRDRITPGRWWKVFSEFAHELQLLVIRPPRESPPLRNLITTIEHELIDPHTTRKPLLSATLGRSETASRQRVIGS